MSDERTTGKGGSVPGTAVDAGNALRAEEIDDGRIADLEVELDDAMSPAERREEYDMPLGRELDPDDLAPGDVVTLEEPFEVVRGEVVEVTDDAVVLETEQGESRYPRQMIDSIRESRARGIPAVDVGDGSATDVREAMERWVARGDSDLLLQRTRSIPIDDETADTVLDGAASTLARAKFDAITARTVGALSYVGDQVDRAFAGEADSDFEAPRFVMGFSEEPARRMVTHETAHGVLQAYGFSQVDGRHSTSWDHEVPDFYWDPMRSDDPQPQQKYAIGLTAESNSYDATPAFGRSEWEPTVDEQVGSLPDPETFSNVPNPGMGRGEWWAESAGEGDLVRFERPVSLTGDDPSAGSQVWQIADVESGGAAGDRQRLTLENWSGERFVARTTDDGVLQIRSQIHSRDFLPAVSGHRESTGDWGFARRDPDAVLGSTDPDTGEEAVATLAKRANEAWYRQAAIKREIGAEAARAATIKNTYSATHAHETYTKLHEAMQGVRGATDNDDGIEAAVEYHPELVEAYRHVFEIDDAAKQRLNEALADRGAEFRFD